MAVVQYTKVNMIQINYIQKRGLAYETICYGT